nr:PRC-barrel domain-containing protein [Pseudopedobacter sp.]
MQHTINSLIGFKMDATDGEIGEVKEFYFDDESWAIRYLVLETGNWFFHKKVLIAPQALLSPDWKNKNFPINLTKAQIKSSPDIDTDQPISLRQEIEMYGHYAWQRYGGSGFYAGGTAGVMDLPPIIDEEIIKANDPAVDHTKEDPHLRSTEIVTGYHIHAIDGEIGHVKDFMMDDQTWTLTNLLIDTHNWFGGKKVLIPVRHVKEILWADYKINLDTTTAFIKDEPSFKEESFTY